MKQTNLPLYLLCILCASFILFKCRASYGYTTPPPVTLSNIATSGIPYNQSILDEIIEVTKNRTNNAALIDSMVEDYAYNQLRKPLEVIEGGKINTQTAKPLYYTPPGVTSSLPLAGLVSGAAGIAGLAYYQRTGVDPLYAAASAVASAADHIFVPAYQAFQDVFVSPESFPAAAGQYVGVEGSIGATVGDILEHVENSDTENFPELKNLISANISQPVPTIPSSIDLFSLTGLVLSQGGNNYAQVNGGNWVSNTSGYAEQQYTMFLSLISPLSTILHGTYKEQPAYLGLSPNKQIIMYSVGAYSVANGALGFRQIHIYNIFCIATNLSETYPAPDGAVNYDALKNALSNPSPSVSSELKEAVKEIPDDKKGVSSNPAPSSVPAQVQPAINQQQVQNFYAQNASSVANYNTTNITDNSTSTQIAQGQAATEAAQAKASEKLPDATFKGDAALPDANEYDPEFEQPEEEDFVDKVHSFINSGLPVISSIKASHLTASGSPQMSTSIWGHSVDIDFSGQQTVLRAAGAVLVTISLILSYLVIVRS
jgi:hypothetical protein